MCRVTGEMASYRKSTTYRHKLKKENKHNRNERQQIYKNITLNK